MRAFNRNLLALAAGGLFAATVAAAPAKADIINGWTLNLSNANALGGPFTGMTDVNNIARLNLTGGHATIQQTYVNGSVLGQSFSESGSAFISTYDDTVGHSGVSFGFPVNHFGSTAQSLYLTFSLNGQVDGSGNLIFQGGQVNLYLGSNNNQPPSVLELLATFDDVPGTGGSNIGANGGLPSGSVAVTVQKDASSPVANLFTGPGGALDGLADELFNIQPVLDPSVNPNPTPILPGTSGVQTIVTTEQGQMVLTTQPVPEPASLALLSAGLLGLGGAARRRIRR